MIIIFSSISSTLSLLQYNQNDQNDQFSYTYYSSLIVKIFLTILTILTTLISAWMKKQNYVENISESSKYSLKINKLKGDVNSVMREPIDTLMSYDTFINKYKELEKIEPLKDYDDVSENKNFWNKNFSRELQLRLMMQKPIDLELMKCILSLNNYSPVKIETIKMLEQIQSQAINLNKIGAK